MATTPGRFGVDSEPVADHLRIELRAATPDDAPTCGDLLFSTWPGLYLALLGDRARAAVALAALFRAPGNTFSWETSRVAVRQGRVIGLAASYPAEQGHRRATGSLWPTLLALGPVSFVGVVARIWKIADASIGIDPGHFYVANVAVLAQARGRGTGALLLADAECRARERACPGISLEVDGANGNARQFYERLGYRVVESRESRRLAALTGSGTRVLMSKQLEP